MIYVLNGSPRKNQNTAKMCQSFAEGAESAGARTSLLNLYDLDFKGCHSCFACKLKGGKSYGRCSWPDGLREWLAKICMADGLAIGSPIYFGDVTSQTRAFLERLVFPFLRYDAEHSSIAPKKLRTALLYTMNAPKSWFFEKGPGRKDSDSLNGIASTLGGIFSPPKIVHAFDTFQFPDYALYDAPLFNVEEKKRQQETEFPKELASARECGAEMARELAAA